MGLQSRLRRTAGCLLVAMVVTMTRAVHAEDGALALREVISASDFRVRVNAALVLGRVHPVGARGALEHALGDPHPAVRAASAEALGSLGDPAALPALDQRSSAEPARHVKEQLRAAMDLLRDGAPALQPGARAGHVLAPEVQYVIALGAMHNATGVRGEELTHVLSDAARSRTHALRGAAVMDNDGSTRKQAAIRHIPVITLDGNVAQIVESRVAGSVQVHARVEFTVRRDQTLRGTVSGAATSFGSGVAISDQARRQLQNDAVDGAVQSALRGAEQGLIVAAR